MIWRGLREEDLAACLSVDPARIGAETVGYNRAINAWRDLMRSTSFHSAVIEADPPVAGHRIVAFGASVFVSRVFADEKISNPSPGLNACIIASIAAGQAVVLNKAELRSANTEGGLDLVVLYGNWRKDMISEQVSEAQMLLTSSFLQLHRGFRLNRLIFESMDEGERKSYIEASGAWQTISDFSEFYSEHPNTHWNRGRSLGLTTRNEAFRSPGNITALLFQYNEPVLRLQEADQQLLNAALTGLTDEELALNLAIRLPTVKKRWRALFERASTHADLFHDMCDGLEGSGRGRQKRQFILTYVRDHPEELRPFESKDRSRERILIREQSRI
jgi:hypothetical protein